MLGHCVSIVQQQRDTSSAQLMHVKVAHTAQAHPTLCWGFDEHASRNDRSVLTFYADEVSL